MINNLKPFILPSLIVLFFIMETLFPYFRYGKEGNWKHSINNILLGVTNTLITFLLFSWVYTIVFDTIDYFKLGSFSILHLPRPLFLVVIFVFFDFWMYSWHRINHTVPFFGKFHLVHHTDRYLQAASAVRFHPIEIFFSSLFRIFIFIAIGMTTEELILYETILYFSIVFHHSNIRFPHTIDRIYRTVFVSPEMHRMHHSIKQKEANSNYGSVFSFWDRLFGTYTIPRDTANLRLGVPGYSDKKWQWYPVELVTPFINADKKKRNR